jgi:hypothetical protein
MRFNFSRSHFAYPFFRAYVLSQFIKVYPEKWFYSKVSAGTRVFQRIVGGDTALSNHPLPLPASLRTRILFNAVGFSRRAVPSKPEFVRRGFDPIASRYDRERSDDRRSSPALETGSRASATSRTGSAYSISAREPATWRESGGMHPPAPSWRSDFSPRIRCRARTGRIMI